MASLTARVTAFILRKTGVYRRMFAGADQFARTRTKLTADGIGPSPAQERGLAVQRDEFQGRCVWTIAPTHEAPTATVLFWHGGGYVYPPMSGHWDYFAVMARKYGWRVIAPLYPLAPDSTAEATTAFALDFYRELVAREGAPVLMGGDSAGGGLAAATAMALRDAGLPLPKGLLLVCPWLDIDPAHEDQRAIEPRDAVLTIPGVRDAGVLYAGQMAMNDPRVSPIYGDWSGLPPILCFGGGDDILVTDARRLKAAMPAVDYEELAGLIHDWPLFTFPESRAAQSRMAGFAAKTGFKP
jgi:monoterpene epsilon-lactone hydrolase